MKNFVHFILVALFCLSAPAISATIPADSQTVLQLYLTPKEAYQKMLAHPRDILFIDVRTPCEVQFNGMPTIADINIPVENIDLTRWNDTKHQFSVKTNPNFEQEVANALKAKKLDKQSPIFIICRSAKRSAFAVNLLAKAGYTNAYNILFGFEGDAATSEPKKGQRIINGWKNDGLPWTTELDKNKVFIR